MAQANRCKVSTHEDEATIGAGETFELEVDEVDPTTVAKGLEALSTETGGRGTTPLMAKTELLE